MCVELKIMGHTWTHSFWLSDHGDRYKYWTSFYVLIWAILLARQDDMSMERQTFGIDWMFCLDLCRIDLFGSYLLSLHQGSTSELCRINTLFLILLPQGHYYRRNSKLLRLPTTNWTILGVLFLSSAPLACCTRVHSHQ